MKRDYFFILFTSTLFPVLGSHEPFLRLSVREYIFGYEDELACLDTDNPEESSEGDSFFDDDDSWDAFDESSSSSPSSSSISDSGSSVPEKKHRFRQPDGRCLFGALSERNMTWENPVTILTGGDKLENRGRIVSRDLNSAFKTWTPDSVCDKFAGSQEPSTLAPFEHGDGFDLFMGIMCRKIRMTRSGSVMYDGGIRTDRYTASPDTFNFTRDDECYEQKKGRGGLPFGAMSISKCVEGAPLAVSFPRFLYGSQR